ncbi:unnamed protein product, partial [Staurois parvus]
MGPLLTPGPRSVPEFSNGQSAPGYMRLLDNIAITAPLQTNAAQRGKIPARSLLLSVSPCWRFLSFP